MRPRVVWVVIPGSGSTAWNTGTIWGLFQDQTSVLIAVRIAMVLGIVALVWKTRASERLKQLAFGLVLGGALGNLYDNLTQESRGVRDFLDFIPLWRDDPTTTRPSTWPTLRPDRRRAAVRLRQRARPVAHRPPRSHRGARVTSRGPGPGDAPSCQV
jgi:hypothetical protein